MSVTIRQATPSDATGITVVIIAAFRDAAHTSHTEQFIVHALRRAGQLTVSLVAESDGDIVGHVAVSPVSISDGAQGWYGLGPIAVSLGMQGRGIGSQLMEAALDALRGLGAQGCVLLGDPAYYARFGFRPEPGLRLPDVPPEYFQALAFGAALPQGTVTYHAAFGVQGPDEA